MVHKITTTKKYIFSMARHNKDSQEKILCMFRSAGLDLARLLLDWILDDTSLPTCTTLALLA